jgi:hypothetical protein
LTGADVSVDDQEIRIAGKAVSLDIQSPYEDMRID